MDLMQGESVNEPATKWQRGASTLLRSAAFIPVALSILTFAMFAGVLTLTGDRVLSAFGNDLSGEFVYWRQFGFDQLRHGHIALWNPHVFGGVPFMGGFQAALFYPPDWIYLVVPLHIAINFEIVLHVFLLGLFMAAWIKRLRLHPAAVLVASAVMMFGGAFFLHIYPGHLATLDAMAWIPLLLRTVDELIDGPAPKWVFIGIFALSMQVLAGHPQTVFNTLVTCSVYGAMRLLKAPRWKHTVLAIVIVGVGVLAITAVQLWTGVQSTGEGTRQGGVPFAFAASFSFPPENFLTFLVPGFFGNMVSFPYWGRWYLWEMSAFFGLTGLTLAIVGTTVKFATRTICGVMLGLLVVLASGSHAPLLQILYHVIPGFDHFRSPSKFMVEAAMFMAVFAGVGADHLIWSARGTRLGAIAALATALALAAGGFSLRYASSFPAVSAYFGQFLTGLGAIGESYLPVANYGDSRFIAEATAFAGSRCLIAAAVMFAVAVLLVVRSYRREAAYALAAMAVAEVFVFAHSTLVTFSLAATVPTAVQDFIDVHPGDYRILQLPYDSNGAIAIGADDIWGYDPMVLNRYAQLMTFSQGGTPADADMYVQFSRPSPLFRILRLGYIFQREKEVREMKDALPHFLLVQEWARASDRDGILQSLNSSSFDPRRTVILEGDPAPAPQSGEGASGTVQLLRGETDSLSFSAKLDRPSLLLITDTYSRYWRAVSEPGSAQKKYTVMPADYTLMVVPLSAGKHLFRLEYAPSGYLIGRWVSLSAIAIYIFAIGLVHKRHRRNRDPEI
jgi:hypothetical protein